MLADIFSKPEISNDEIKTELDAKHVVITHDLILDVLKNPDIDSGVARRIFNWVSESKSEILSSNSYNLMLGILGGNGLVKESWELIGVMKEKGYGVKKGAFLRISERFMKDGASDDVEKLKDLYAMGSASIKNIDGARVNSDCVRVSGIIRDHVWGDDVEKQLKESGVEFSSDLVAKVLGVLEADPNKALIFFRWLEDSVGFEHDRKSYNALARVLGKEDHSEKFWRLVDEMSSKGHEMEKETYFSVFKKFLQKQMIEDAVNLYELAMGGADKPSVEDFTMLLKKIVVSEELDMNSFRKAVGVFSANGNAFTDNILDAVIKSLTGAGKMKECNRILAALKKAGYVPSDSLQRKIAYKLSSLGEIRKAMEFMDKIVPSFDYAAWVSLVHGFCDAKNLDGALKGVEKMAEKLGVCGGRPVHLLIDLYCDKNRPLRACQIVSKMVDEKGVRPWLSTYKTLTEKLLSREHFKEALDIMSMMKSQGYPADSDSFIKYLSKKGTVEDAVTFTQSMTSKRFPAAPAYVRLFEAYFSAKRLDVAHDFLAQCPSHVKNHADVLDLFSSKASDAKKTGTNTAPETAEVAV